MRSVFNFNKSCIWIHDTQSYELIDWYLTLTRVVFEYDKIKVLEKRIKDLTLTRVVFEFIFYWNKWYLFPDLTLTRVVFE